MPLPACATLSWYQLSSSWFCSPLAIALDVGFLVESEIFVSYHQLLITHCASRSWSSLNILLFGSNFFCLLSKTISFPKYLLYTVLVISISAVCVSLRPMNFSLQFVCTSGEGSWFVLTDSSNFLLQSKTNAVALLY